jgi:hypothetical protein
VSCRRRRKTSASTRASWRRYPVAVRFGLVVHRQRPERGQQPHQSGASDLRVCNSLTGDMAGPPSSRGRRLGRVPAGSGHGGRRRPLLRAARQSSLVPPRGPWRHRGHRAIQSARSRRRRSNCPRITSAG